MILADVFLFAEVAPAVFRWGRIQESSDSLLPLLVFILFVLYFYRRYRSDTATLKHWQRILLLSLRFLVLVALLLFYLKPQWEHIVGSSRVAVLVDTSASMGNHDVVENNTGEAGPNRLEAITDWLQRSDMVNKILEKHDIAVYSFDKTAERIFQHTRDAGEENVAENNLKDAGAEAPASLGTSLEVFAALKAEGVETRLDSAISEVLQNEKGRPLTGIVVITDGRETGKNTDSLNTAAETAVRQQIPIFTIGVGKVQQAVNFRVANIDVPERAFPNDPFTAKVSVEKIGGNETDSSQTDTFPLELWSQKITDGQESNELQTKIGEKTLTFKNFGVQEAVFEIRLAEPQKIKLTAKITPPDADKLEEDNKREAETEVVDRKDRVLLFASAPTRDYQFLCTQIHRDKSMSADVYLPWSKPGASQNAEKILTAFPSNPAEISQYDIIIAFDPNWRDLSTEQINNLEHWVGRMGGGLLLVAGNVFQNDAVAGWVTDMTMDKIRALYPVEFFARQSAFDHRYHGEEKPSPLKFTPQGEEAEFLRTSDNAVESRAFWNDFPGFYGFFAVRGVKPAATLYVSSGSPEAAGKIGSGALVVSQFYGAGRVLYIGSGELWRLRRIDDKMYEKLTTRMLRYVSQGRLQRESDRGSLTAGRRRYTLGRIAQLRITANDAQLRPLTMPELPVDVISPSGALRTVQAAVDPNVPGTYQVHLPLSEEGNWTVRLFLPDSDLRLERILQVQMSDSERENPSRNETLLRSIAETTGGVYYANPTDALPL
ncbi:MAG: VWA domain-containing protein, partial [Planctomycetaceae bacterium]|nr:VWA domain-containing protein [Planctomycetaceae bacterium]